MKKSVKLSIAMALMMGATAGMNAVAPSTASAEISDKFRMEVNGITSYYHDTDRLYYKNTRTDGKKNSTGWNNYTRLQLTYYVDDSLRMVARLHSGYDSLGNKSKNYNETGAYFDQSYLQYDAKKSNLHFILGKKGMTLGQSMVYNSTGNLNGIQVSYGNWYDPFCVQLTYGDGKSGNRVWSAQVTKSVSKATSFNATYVTGDSLYNNNTYYLKDSSGKIVQEEDAGKISHQRDSFIDFGGKVKFHGVTLVGEWAKNLADHPQTTYYNYPDPASKKAWFIELYTGPTNDFGSGLPLQKVGTHAFSVRWQDIGAHGTYGHNNTFYDDRKGIRFDYGMVLKKGLSFDVVYGRMQDKGTSAAVDRAKGHWSNIFVASLAYKFR